MCHRYQKVTLVGIYSLLQGLYKVFNGDQARIYNGFGTALKRLWNEFASGYSRFNPVGILLQTRAKYNVDSH